MFAVSAIQLAEMSDELARLRNIVDLAIARDEAEAVVTREVLSSSTGRAGLEPSRMVAQARWAFGQAIRAEVARRAGEASS
jgi:hypothetical protein